MWPLNRGTQIIDSGRRQMSIFNYKSRKTIVNAVVVVREACTKVEKIDLDLVNVKWDIVTWLTKHDARTRMR